MGLPVEVRNGVIHLDTEAMELNRIYEFNWLGMELEIVKREQGWFLSKPSELHLYEKEE